jgi:CRP-like cAMP-binding protein
LLRSLASGGQSREYEADDVLIHEGEPAHSLFLILSGRVKVRRRTADGEVVLAVRGPGEPVGELCVLNSVRNADVVTLERCRLMLISRDEFLPAVRSNPDLAFWLIQTLGQRLSEAGDRLVLRSQDAPARVAAAVLELRGRPREAEATAPGVPFSLKQLAATADTTPETACRILGRFERLGFLRRNGRRLVVLNEGGLRQQVSK